METKAAVVGKSRMDEIKNQMASFQSELNQMGSHLQRFNHLNVDRLNNAME